MKQEVFEARFGERWSAFDRGIGLTQKQRKALAASGDAPPWPLDELPARYRELCHHLALARDRQYSTALVERLERLVLAGHQMLYGARETSGGVLRFLLGGFPRLVRRERRYVYAAALMFFGPLFACLIAIQFYPDFAQVVLPSTMLAEMQQMYAPGNARLGFQRGAGDDFMMFAHYVGNNVKICFQCFAGGLLFCVGAVFFMVFNGLVIGTVAGHLTHVGYIETFWGFVAGHGAFELTGIVLSGAAGLMLGMALIAPGRQTRFASVKSRMPEIMGMVYGAALLIFLAAPIEAFWSASRVPPVQVKYAVGILLWLVTLAYLIFAGRRGDKLARELDGSGAHDAA
jgi:uncharacterized membrane protein SpoIIM required for sporulation